MSGMGGTAEVLVTCPELRFLARRRHSQACSTTWILPFGIVSLPVEGDVTWNADLPPFLPLT
jgi:hypothetical protein